MKEPNREYSEMDKSRVKMPRGYIDLLEQKGLAKDQMTIEMEKKREEDAKKSYEELQKKMYDLDDDD